MNIRKHLVLGGSMAFLLVANAGCGEKAEAPPPAGSPAETSAQTAPAESGPTAPEPADGTLSIDIANVLKPWTGDLDGMVERRLIRVLTVYSMTIYFVDKGVLRGTAVDYARLFEEELNKSLAKEKKLKNKNLKVRVVFIPMARDELLPALMAGQGDIVAAGLTITPARLKQVDFTTAGMSNVSEVVVTGPASPAISTLDDLSGKSVFVRKSSSYYENLVALNKKFAAARKAPVKFQEAPEALEDEDLLEMLDAGLVPLVVVNKHIADFWKQVFPQITVHSDVVVHGGDEIAWAIRKNTPQLKSKLDDFARRHKVGTSIGNQLLTRYLKDSKHIGNAASDAERKKFLALIDYFKKYGDQYDVDWVLMGAQAYQESQLNQDAKSPVGAIGVMQVMPATGKEMNVGDITKTEANIHAGIKYIRYMIDQYYGKEPMTELDKALFAFASYNAGPARVRKLRAEAGERGLDPNVWFHNVEYVAAERVGQETVTYVANIYKYYIAYRLVLEQQAAQKAAREKLKADAQ